MWQAISENIKTGDIKALARAITLVENEAEGYESFLESIPAGDRSSIIGITGPPGAGKSTLTDALIAEIVDAGKRVAVLCIDPSSPFNLGAVLGDRIRMSTWHNHPGVYIRSMATRGSLGGLNPKILEVTEILKLGGFDHIIIETVGVGQSEIEIAGLADITIVVLVPESGDEVQTMKAGIMEIADIFVVNKADRPGADMYMKNLRATIATSHRPEHQRTPVLSTVASEKKGVDVLMKTILEKQHAENNKDRKKMLMAERAYQLIQQKRMRDISKSDLYHELQSGAPVNLYRFINSKISGK